MRIAESGAVQYDGWLTLDGLRYIGLVRSRSTERHLLQPFDILITARAGSVQLAMTPPSVSETVAGAALLVVWARDAEGGMAHYLWYYLASAFGRRELVKRMTVNATITSLAANSIWDIEVPMPTPRQLELVASLVEASEEASTSAVRVTRLRRETMRDSVIGQIVSGDPCDCPSEDNHAPDQPGLESKLRQATYTPRGRTARSTTRSTSSPSSFLARIHRTEW